ncbi:rab-like GTPase activating protein [Strigomonas culicis]|uniref:Rab-like GTPase activating protein n=1 Tax=Strigomonas culicis TaxID=28005 RepID=S9V9I4_9TRYP|nr:rab-like GTPase activating protein [Strigomonas culicis]|eukprot:EPY23636.1 rab-like GTPase activating protein [Strigomonas culicis]
MLSTLHAEEVHVGGANITSTTGRRFRVDMGTGTASRGDVVRVSEAQGEASCASHPSDQPVFSMEEYLPCFDSFGFRVTQDEKILEQQYARAHPTPTATVRKWQYVLQHWNDTSMEIKKKLCRQGIPQQYRKQAWSRFLLGGSGKRSRHKGGEGGSYTDYRDAPLADRQAGDIIERDLDRTFPTHQLFETGSQGAGQRQLRNILRAYVNYNPQVGYCQGMGFLAATLLLQIENEENTFWCFCGLMEHEPYEMKHLYQTGFPGLHMHFFVFERLLQQTNKKVYQHIHDDHNINSSFYATHWFLTVFTYYLNFNLISRIWDRFLCEGWKPVYRIALALLKMDRALLLSQNTETGVLLVLKSIQENKDPSNMLKISQQVKFKTSFVNKLKRDYTASLNNEKQ